MIIPMAYHHLFFDLDGTVTPSRSKIGLKMKTLLASLKQDIVIISGSTTQQIAYQTDNLPIITMGQNGNHTVHPHLGELWQDQLSLQEKEEVLAHARLILDACDHDVPDPNDLIEDRGSQISVSLYGHHADPETKRAFDGDFKKRKALLERFPFVSEHIEVKLGGSTCLDYFRKGKDKGYNISRLIDHLSWQKDECLFFGDALFEGGNDESVIGIIETVAVTDPDDCYAKLMARLG